MGTILALTWAAVYIKIKRDLVKEYKLDQDLRVNTGIRTAKLQEMNALRKFKRAHQPDCQASSDIKDDMFMQSVFFDEED